MHNYPLLLGSLPKTAPWGGDNLEKLYGKSSSFEKCGESWELSVRPDQQSVIQNGPAAGKTLRDYLGDAHRPFPLLIKLIDACDKLSIQVHPNDEEAARFGDLGKTEMWYILHADPGACLIYGLKPGITAAQFRAALEAGSAELALHYQPVREGECYFIPAGMVHGIGAGIVVAEIQQNSDLTYRVYDYDRADQNGRKRPLHVEQAIKVLRPFTPEEVEALRFAKGRAGLVQCDYFSVFLQHAPYSDTATHFQALLILSGSGAITAGGVTVLLKAGDCCYLPDQLGPYQVTGALQFLITKETF